MFILVIIIRFVLLATFMVYQLNNFSLSISQLRTSRGPLQNAFTRFSVMVLVSSRRRSPFLFPRHPSDSSGNEQPRKCLSVNESTENRNAV